MTVWMNLKRRDGWYHENNSSVEKLGLLVKGVSKIITNGAKEQKCRLLCY